MIGIDTNVLVRYYVDDNEVQHKKAKRFIDTNDIFLNNIVLLETFWVLSTVYRLPKSTIEEIFDHLKRLSNVYLENDMVFARALLEYRDNGCDFADALLGLLNKHFGCATVSFDKLASRKLGFKLL